MTNPRAPSAHYADGFQPVESLGTPDPPSYNETMTGRGRWFIMRDATGLFGTLWTNDGDALGLLPIIGATPGHPLAAYTALRAAFRSDVPASTEFNYLARIYPATIHYSDLAELYLHPPKLSASR